MRHLAAFFVLGALLFGVKREAEARLRERPTLVVTVSARATPPEVERAIDEAVAFDQALRHGGAVIDPVVRDQLLRSMRVTDGARGEDELLDRALALGLHRADPVVRERLAFQAQQLLRARVRVPSPDASTLAAYLAAHAERYRVPARCSFDQVFLSRSRRPATLEADARELAERLSRGDIAPERAHDVSDPAIFSLHEQDVSAAQLDARFGPGFGERVLTAQLARWSAVIESPYGVHFVFVRSRSEARLPAASELRDVLTRDYTHDHIDREVRRELHALRERYRVDVRRLP